jgi:hypothetical protein
MGLYINNVKGGHTRVTLLNGKEAVGYALPEVVGAEGLGIHIDIAEDAVGAQVVESAHVVVVFVSNEYRIDGLEFGGEHLLSEVGSAVDEYAPASLLN